MSKYDFKSIEVKWQNYWEENQSFKAERDSSKKNITYWKCFPTRREESTWVMFEITGLEMRLHGLCA